MRQYVIVHADRGLFIADDDFALDGREHLHTVATTFATLPQAVAAAGAQSKDCSFRLIDVAKDGEASWWELFEAGIEYGSQLYHNHFALAALIAA